MRVCCESMEAGKRQGGGGGEEGARRYEAPQYLSLRFADIWW